MKQVVYIDVLFILNLFIDYLLLLLGTKLLHNREKRWRMLLGALIGAVYSVLVFFTPSFSFFTTSLIKLLVSMVIVAVAYRCRSVRSYLKGVACFYAATFAFTGILIALWFAFRPNGLLLNNGAVYFNISSLTLIFSSVASYSGISLISRFMKRNMPKDCKFELTIRKSGSILTGSAFLDTGNSLTDGFSDAPVIVASYQWIQPLLPQEVRPCFCGESIMDYSHSNPDFPIRLIPTKTVSGTQLLCAFAPDEIILKQGGKEHTVRNVIVAVTQEAIGNGEYQALLPSVICNL